MKSYTNSQVTFLIDEHIHSKRDREIMKLHYVDGISAEKIAEVYELTPPRPSRSKPQ